MPGGRAEVRFGMSSCVFGIRPQSPTQKKQRRVFMRCSVLDRKNSAEILFPRYVHLIFAGSYVARSEKMLSHSTVTRAKQQGDPGRAIGLLSPP